MTSSSLFAQAKRYIPGGVNSPVRAFRNVGGEPFFVARAKGSHIWDVEGHEYIDYVGTWGPAILGHAPEKVVQAVQAAAEQGLSFGIPNPAEVEMAELICRWVPSVEKVRMVNSGTEATMSCIRLARGFTGRKLIVKFAFNEPDEVRTCFQQFGDRIAAVILEPVPANAGLYLPKPGFLDLLRHSCSQSGALLIFDEVMTGFRLARGGYQELCGVRPDLTAMGKVIGGGLPVGAFGGRADVMDRLSPDGPVYQAGTLSGNPLALAAGLAQLRQLEAADGYRRLEQLGSYFEQGVRKILQETNFVFHRIGSMFCLFFTAQPVENLAGAQRSDLEAFKSFFHFCRQHGIYFAPSQFETGFLCLAHTETDIDRTLEVMAKALSKK